MLYLPCTNGMSDLFPLLSDRKVSSKSSGCLSFPVVHKRETERLVSSRPSGHSDYQILLGEFPEITFVVNLGQNAAASSGKPHKFTNTGDHRLRSGAAVSSTPLS